MEEAPDDADAQHDAPVFMSVTAAPTDVGISLPVVRADDVANNPHTPAATDVAARAAYILEVGTRKLSLTRTPLQTPNSRVRQPLLELLYNRLFNEWSNAECRTAYNASGGAVATDQAVSKPFLKFASKWFEEEDVVLPWDAGGSKEQKRLKGLGLGQENFPFVVSVAVKLKKMNKRTTLLTRMRKVRGDMGMDDNELNAQQGLADNLEAQLRQSLAEDERKAAEEDHEARLSATILPGHMLDRVRAAVNIFSKDLAILDSSARGQSVTVVRAALLENCSAPHDHYVLKNGYRQARP
ncbi:hypothetical protein HBI56_050520 [Parastagonospora nodorum]|nr:hypothetical protein HBH76_032380 [Parastagonospora nodorum]KAH6505855.1 hypothetical protein HBI55_003990 [Parastagonospora nodorum]KAH6537203.1 hypothetical protein HBI56_050520 [Parastagonospora nodorum]